MNSPDQLMIFYLLGSFFIMSFVLALFIMPLSSKIATYFKIVDHPDNSRKLHRSPVSRLGGLAISLSVFITIIMTQKQSSFIQGFLVGMAIIVLVGLIDDKKSITPLCKFVFEVVAVVFFVVISGIKLKTFGNIFGLGQIQLGYFSFIVTVFAMVGFTNSLNLADGLDGLAAGISVIVCLFFILFAYSTQQWGILSLGMILLGSLIGFLRYNSHPAQLFMGDTGSLFLGYALSALAVAITQCSKFQVNIQPITVLWVLSLPVIDTLIVMTSRLIKGKKPFSPDRTHLHHRLLDRGISHANTVSFIYAIVFITGSIGWWLKELPEHIQFYLILSIYLLLYSGLHLIEKKKLSPDKLVDPNLFSKFTTPNFPQKIVTIIKKGGQIAPCAIIISLTLPFFFLTPIIKPFGLFSLIIFIFTLIFFPWRNQERKSDLFHPLLYILIYSLIIIYLFNPALPSWVLSYLMVISSFFFVWSASWLLHHQNFKNLIPNSFELLLIVISLFIPLLWGQTIQMEATEVNLFILSCLFSIPFITATKITINQQLRSGTRLIMLLGGIFLLLGVRSFW